MLQLTKLQIIDETVEYYSNNPRSVCGTECRYIGPNGENCAFSRCCSDPTSCIPYEGGNHMLWFVKSEYRGHGLEFWKQIQDLHDLSIHWEGNKLTKIGQDHVKKLKERFC